MSKEDEELEDRWIDRHSVGCLLCGNLVDERDCICGPEGEGSICSKCQIAPEHDGFMRQMEETAEDM